MDELRELYQEAILDHNRRPRNYRKLETANRTAEGYNPLCGDRFTVCLTVEGDIVRDIGFQGTGCAISTASASMMTESVKRKSLTEVRRLFEQFHALLTEESFAPMKASELGKLAVFAGVREFPIRVKCATLPWHTLRAALEQQREPVSTEQAAGVGQGAGAGPPGPAPPRALEQAVIEVLRRVYDPEIPVNVYDLGLIYDIAVDPSGVVGITMTLTSPACPVAMSLVRHVESKVATIPGVVAAKVKLVWDPPWSHDMMSEAARLQLGL